MLDLFDNSDKTGNLKFSWLIVLFSRSEEPWKKEDELNKAIARPTSVEKVFVGRGMKYHHSKVKFFEGIWFIYKILSRLWWTRVEGWAKAFYMI